MRDFLRHLGNEAEYLWTMPEIRVVAGGFVLACAILGFVPH